MTFEQAWGVVKMARQKVGPVEIWDINEPSLRGSYEGDHEKLDELGVPYERDDGPEPEWHRKWREGTRWEGDEPPRNVSKPWTDRTPETWDEKYRFKTNYVPMGGSPWFGNMAAKVRMTPTEFLSLNVPMRLKYAERGGQKVPDKLLESPFDYFNSDEDFSGVGRMAQSMKEGYPIFIPNIDVRRVGDGEGEDRDFKVTGHEGRHRMAALHGLLGDVPVPVQISSDEFGRKNEQGVNTIGGRARPSSEMQRALLGAVLGGRENLDARVTIGEFEDEMWD